MFNSHPPLSSELVIPNTQNMDIASEYVDSVASTPSEDDSNTQVATLKTSKRSSKGVKSHKDAYKETHVAFLKLFVEDKPFAEIQYILGLKKAQMDKHVSDAIFKGVMPGKPQYRCALWEDLGPEVRATMTNGCKGKLVKIEGEADSVIITLYDPQLALN